jgi:co-chaperonin GroES (HSP10)
MHSPIGARVIVKEIVTTLSLEERGKKSGLTVITSESNRPRSTQGRVIALGTDPFLRDNGLEEGCVVWFAPHAGIRVVIEDEEFRSLELQEIIMVSKEKVNDSNTGTTNISTGSDPRPDGDPTTDR